MPHFLLKESRGRADPVEARSAPPPGRDPSATDVVRSSRPATAGDRRPHDTLAHGSAPTPRAGARDDLRRAGRAARRRLGRPAREWRRRHLDPHAVRPPAHAHAARRRPPRGRRAGRPRRRSTGHPRRRHALLHGRRHLRRTCRRLRHHPPAHQPRRRRLGPVAGGAPRARRRGDCGHRLHRRRVDRSRPATSRSRPSPPATPGPRRSTACGSWPSTPPRTAASPRASPAPPAGSPPRWPA